MDFAPYQDTPERTRALSPPIRSSLSYTPPLRSPALHSPKLPSSSHGSDQWPPASSPFMNRSSLERQQERAEAGGYFGNGVLGERRALDDFTTSLGIRMDWEACLAYAFLPPAGAVFLLIFERKSDFIRFHAWQSALLFSLMFIIQMIFVWSHFIFWLIFCIDLGLIAFLIWKAYTDADTLDRFELPYIGALAARFVDDE